MLSILRFIASPKTTVFLLLLLAISIVLSIAGPNTLQALHSAGFEKGLQSWPFLIGLGLLLLNQLFAVFVRIGRSRKKAPSVEEEEEDFIEWDTPQNEWETELDEKPKKKPSKPLPPPRAMGKASYGIDTVLPASNVKSLIETLGFTITSAEELGDEKEQIDARKGPSSAWYTLFIHVGAVVFLTGWLLSLSMYPLQKVSIYMGKNNKANLKKTVHPPMMGWLQKIGLTKDNSTTYPALDVSLVNMKQEFRSYQYFNHTYNKLAPKKNKLDVAQQSVDSLFMNLRKPTLKQAHLERRVAFSASLLIGATKQPILLHQNQSIQHKGYNITLARAFTKATLDIDGKKVELTSGAMHKLSKTESLKLLYTKHNAINPTAGCLQVAIFKAVKGKQTPIFEGCLQPGQKLPKSSIPVALSSIQQGVRLHYRPRLGFLLILSGLLLFVFGFIGFWWPQRYTLSLEWNRTENKLQLEGTGYDVIPRELAHGISESLYFPASQIKSHQQQSSSSPSSPPVPTPPQRQTVANIQGQQSQAAVANVPAPNQRQTQLHGHPSQAPAPQGQTARQVKAQSPAPQRQTAQKRVPQAQQPKQAPQAPQKPAAQGQTARQVTNQPQAAQRQTAQKRAPQAQQPVAQRQTQAKAPAPQGQTARQVKAQSPAPQRQTAQKRVPQAQQPKQAPQAPQKPAAQGQTARQVTKQPAAQSTAGIGAFNQQVAPPKAKKSTTAAHGTSQPKAADISVKSAPSPMRQTAEFSASDVNIATKEAPVSSNAARKSTGTKKTVISSDSTKNRPKQTRPQPVLRVAPEELLGERQDSSKATEPEIKPFKKPAAKQAVKKAQEPKAVAPIAPPKQKAPPKAAAPKPAAPQKKVVTKEPVAVPKATNQKNSLDIDSLLGKDKEKKNNAMIDDLDIDSLFDDFEENLTKKK